MCGICADISYNGVAASVGAVASMCDAMATRGPDGEGVFSQRRAVFGHRRLKVIDRSEHAQQPMVDSDLGLVLVYNGAIYNYPALRRCLEGKGYRFFSSGDTEVILKAYDAWGPQCVEHFNGMFAFALWHRDTGRMFVARDRLGIKPLYYSETSDGLRFASTLPALLAAGNVDTTIDPVALHHYMTFHSVVPPPRTILKGVRKLEPATRMTIEPDGRRRSERYWSLDFGGGVAGDPRTGEEWKEALLDTLTSAVNRRMLADVPVGVLLSGGVDSSLIVALLTRLGQEELNTFSIGFEAAGGEVGDEFEYSDMVAHHCGTRHHKIRVDSSRLLESLDACVAAMSEPMVSHDCVGFYLLSEEVSRHVTVVQSGQGADEVFAGYRWYPPLADSTDSVTDYAAAFFDRDHAETVRAVASPFAGRDHSLEYVQGHFGRLDGYSAIDQALHLDTTVMLVDDPVKRVDNMTMAWGLEARVPFLDHEVVELAARLPSSLKVPNGGKYLLKELARDLLPARVVDRPKGYFPVPALKYLRGAVLGMIRERLDRPAARGRQLFQRRYVEALLDDPSSHLTPLGGSKLWQLALLEYWLQTHGI